MLRQLWELVPPEKRISTGQLVNLNLVTSQPSDYLRWTRAGNHLYATASNDWSEKPNKIDRTSRCSSVGRPSQAVPWNSPDLCTFDRVMHPGVVIRNAVSASLHLSAPIFFVSGCVVGIPCSRGPKIDAQQDKDTAPCVEQLSRGSRIHVGNSKRLRALAENIQVLGDHFFFPSLFCVLNPEWRLCRVSKCCFSLGIVGGSFSHRSEQATVL